MDENLSANIQGRLLKLENLFDTIRNSSEQSKAALHSAIDPIESEIKTITSSLPAIDLRLNALQSQITVLTSLWGKNVSELSEKINQNMKEIGKAQESISLCNANNVGAKATLNSHDVRFEEHESNLKALKELIVSQKELYEELKKEIKECAGNNDALNTSMSGVAAWQADMMRRGDYEAKIKALYEEISEFKQKTERVESQFHNHLNIRIDDLKTYFDKNLSEIPKPVEKPAYDPAQEILTELQGLRLDVQNAVLKNNNLDTQYKMQDKRIENMVLNLQKLQLGK